MYWSLGQDVIVIGMLCVCYTAITLPLLTKLRTTHLELRLNNAAMLYLFLISGSDTSSRVVSTDSASASLVGHLSSSNSVINGLIGRGLGFWERVSKYRRDVAFSDIL